MIFYSNLCITGIGRRQDGEDETGSIRFKLRQPKSPEDVDDLQRVQSSGQDDGNDKHTKEKEDKRLTPHVAMMRPILRYLQLLCENHNRDLQVYNDGF